jgi:hypothetical protein
VIFEVEWCGVCVNVDQLRCNPDETWIIPLPAVEVHEAEANLLDRYCGTGSGEPCLSLTNNWSSTKNVLRSGRNSQRQ